MEKIKYEFKEHNNNQFGEKAVEVLKKTGCTPIIVVGAKPDNNGTNFNIATIITALPDLLITLKMLVKQIEKQVELETKNN